MKFSVVFLRRRTLGCFFVIIFLVSFLVEFYLENRLTQTVFAIPLSGKTVLIDPGHGGVDAGASANGAVEKEINLAVAKLLQEYIETGGGIAYLTRSDDSNTADPNRSKNLSQKMSDLKERKADIGEVRADIFVSIHMNKFEQTKYRGAQVFYDNDSGENKALAEKIQGALKDILKDGNKRVAKPTGDSIFVLRDNPIPSALVECGFLSNQEEAELLKNANYQRKIAWGIYVGIVRYLSN